VGASRLAIAADTACAGDGYNLRGLTADHPCPECGGPASRSLHGSLLKSADPAWLRRLRIGLLLIIATILAELAVTLTDDGLGLLGGLSPLATTVVFLLGAALGLAAVLLITAPEPRSSLSEDPVTLRRVIRACALADVAGSVLLAVGSFLTVRPMFCTVVWLLMLVGVAASFGQFVYLRRFARRIPNPLLAKATTAVMWGLVLAYSASYALCLIDAVTGSTSAISGHPSGVSVTESLSSTLAAPVLVGLLVFGIAYVVLLISYGINFSRVCDQARRQAQTGLPATPPGTLFAHRLVALAPGAVRTGGSPRKTVLAPVPRTPTNPFSRTAQSQPKCPAGQPDAGSFASLTATLWREPNSPQAHFDLAVALANRGRLREAVQQYEEAVRLKEDFVEARMNLANCFARQHRPREAIDQLEATIRLSPSSAAAHFNLGNLLLRDGRVDASIQHYRQAVRLRAGFAGAHYNLGIALLKAGDSDAAAEHFRSVLRINPADARARDKLAAASAAPSADPQPA
jgi:Tfp pilus assembly protein PilF